MSADPARFLVANDGELPSVIVPAPIARFLDAHIRQRGLVTQWRGLDRDLDDVLNAMRYAAVAFSTYAEPRKRLTSRPAPEQLRCVDEEWLTSATVADLLGCGAANVRDLSRRGRLRGGRRSGRTILWPRSAVDEYLAKRGLQ